MYDIQLHPSEFLKLPMISVESAASTPQQQLRTIVEHVGKALLLKKSAEADHLLSKALLMARTLHMDPSICYYLVEIQSQTLKNTSAVRNVLTKLCDEAMHSQHMNWVFHLSLRRMSISFQLNEVTVAWKIADNLFALCASQGLIPASIMLLLVCTSYAITLQDWQRAHHFISQAQQFIQQQSSMIPFPQELFIHAALLNITLRHSQGQGNEALRAVQQLFAFLQTSDAIIKKQMTGNRRLVFGPAHSPAVLDINMMTYPQVMSLASLLAAQVYQTKEPGKAIHYATQGIQICQAQLNALQSIPAASLSYHHRNIQVWFQKTLSAFHKQVLLTNLITGPPKDKLYLDMERWVESIETVTPESQAEIASMQGLLCLSQGELDEACFWLNGCLQKFNASLSHDAKITVLMHLFIAHSLKGGSDDEQKALIYLRQLQDIASSPDHVSRVSFCQSLSAGLQDNYQQSKQHLLNTLQLCQQTLSTHLLTTTLAMLSALYLRTQPEQARRMLQNAVASGRAFVHGPLSASMKQIQAMLDEHASSSS